MDNKKQLVRGAGKSIKAIFDFDGTISTLRCGWEEVMERVMLNVLSASGLPREQLVASVRGYIDESTGIQTIYQMDWLCDRVREWCKKEPLDAWDYKDIYNQALLKSIDEKITRLKRGEAQPEDYLVPGSREFLQCLADQGAEIYIASGTDDADVKNEAALLGVAGFAKLMKGAPYRQKCCSKEAVMKEILESGACEAGSLFMIGDGKVEIMLGAEAGALTIGIASNEKCFDGVCSKKKSDKLRQAGANIIAADFRPLLSVAKALCVKGG